MQIILPKNNITIPATLDRNFGINKEYNINSNKDIKKNNDIICVAISFCE